VPADEDVAVFVAPVPVFDATIFAPTITAPLGSVTVPAISPRTDCAHTLPVTITNNARRTAKTAQNLERLMLPPQSHNSKNEEIRVSPHNSGAECNRFQRSITQS
jgi:hypothetical protein